MSYLDAAHHILREHGAPLHYEEITRRALAQSLIAPKGQSPVSVMASRLYVDTKDEDSRFVRAGPGLFALAQTRRDDISERVGAINCATRDRLRDLIHTMPPDRFEALITELLLQMGFDENTVTVTPYSKDGGIDVVGIYRAAGLTEVNAAVQVKRWKGNIQSQVVTQVRGSLQVHQQGIIITTSDFSKGARSEAAAPGKTRIGLINGNELLDLLIKHRVGVTERPHIVISLDEEWWGELITPAPAVLRLPDDKILVEPQPCPDPTGRKPHTYTLLGELRPASNWRDILVEVCAAMAAKCPAEFAARVAVLHGAKRPWFSTDSTLQNEGLPIPGTDLYVEVHWSAKDTITLIHRILAEFDLPASAVTIDF
jgi:restriction system protein